MKKQHAPLEKQVCVGSHSGLIIGQVVCSVSHCIKKSILSNLSKYFSQKQRTPETRMVYFRDLYSDTYIMYAVSISAQLVLYFSY